MNMFITRGSYIWFVFRPSNLNKENTNEQKTGMKIIVDVSVNYIIMFEDKFFLN